MVNLRKIDELKNELYNLIEYAYLADSRPWIIGYSGGKDSTTVCQLVFETLIKMKKEKKLKLHKPVYIVSSDTMVENPLVLDYLTKSSRQIAEAAEKLGLPIYTKIVRPKIEDTFWTNVIGKGYPTPKSIGYRWCTDRLKIKPSTEFIMEQIEENGEVLILLGVRKAESKARKERIESREIFGRLTNPHDVIPNAYVFNVIKDLSTDDVWRILLSNNGISPWGTDNYELYSLYKDSNSGECPFTITSTKQSPNTPSCGNSRFGCWVCTVVKEDKSLKGFIESGEEWLIPLAEFRDWLLEIRDNPKYRDWKRRDGKVYYKRDTNELGYGPFTLEARRLILQRLLEIQKDMNLELITVDELKKIDEIWDNEGDLSKRMLVDTYYEVIRQRLPWDQYKKPLFEKNVINELKSKCKDFKIPFELISKLILSTERNKYYTYKHIMSEEFEKILTQDWLHFKEIEEMKNDYKQTRS